MEIIIQTLSNIFLYIGIGIILVFWAIYIAKKDKNPEFVVTIKEYSFVGLFLFPVTEIMFILDIIYNFLIKDLLLVPFQSIFVVLIPMFMFHTIKIFKENK